MKPVKKILLTSQAYPNPQSGGIEAMTYTLASEFTRRGYTCLTLFNKQDTPLERFDGDDIFTVRKDIEIWAPFDIAEFVEKNDVDLIINSSTHFEAMNTSLRNFTERSDRKVISIFHTRPGFETHEMKYNKLLNVKPQKVGESLQLMFDYLRFPQLYLKTRKRSKRLRRGNVEVSDSLCVLSRGFVKTFISKYNIPKNEAHKITYMWNPLRFPYKPDEAMANEKVKEVLIVARLEESSKRLSLALKIWNRIERCREFNDWKLTIVGEGPDKGRYSSMIKQLELQRVSMVGRQDPEPYYKKSSIFMVTSSFEGFGITSTEALQYGVIPLAFDTYETLHDIIDNGETGYIIPRGNTREYVRNLKLLMSNEALRQRMSVKAIQSAEKFSVERIADKWEELIANLYK